VNSEFGRGYATCLLQFVFHEPRLTESIEKRLTSSEDMDVTLWANGASDHLYGLITGPRVARADREAALKMAAEALECGHGYTGRKWTFNEAVAWVNTARNLLWVAGDPKTLEEAMEIDRKLGLKPDEGGVSCSTPIPPFRSMK